MGGESGTQYKNPAVLFYCFKEGLVFYVYVSHHIKQAT
jgi:hypothetical protein